MSVILCIRHATTSWNSSKRIQGRRDIPLSDEGRSELAARRIPAQYRNFRWVSSPLCRCVETAEILGGTDVELEPRLSEMDWAAWEGRTLAELRVAYGAEMVANEARGLDFCAPGGESPRQVGQRLAGWLREVGARDQDLIMVSHKGVIRALLALATGWDMKAKHPLKLDWSCAHLFSVDALGAAALRVPNIQLATAPADPPEVAP